MRKPLMIALIAAGMASGGVAVLATQAVAQGAPPPPAGMDGGPLHGPAGDRMRGNRGPGGMRDMRAPGGMMRRMREFALIYPTADRNLSGADVQKIAEAFLLINGNHSWKVTDVKEEQDQVTFALASADGGAIAHFAMDRHTARPTRLS